MTGGAVAGPARRRWLSVVASLLCAALLSGCASLGTWPPKFAGDWTPPWVQKKPLPPVVPLTLPAQWVAPLPHDGQPTELLRWWSQFNDPVLLQLIEAAQRASPSLASAGARIEQARAGGVVAAAALVPQVNQALGISRGRADPGPTGLLATTTTGAVQASWEIDVFGAARAGRDASLIRLEGAQAAWHAARVSVAADTAASYIALRACEAQLLQAKRDTGSRALSARVTELGAQAGLFAPATAALSRASLAQGRAQVSAFQQQCDTLVKGLVALTALDEAALRQQLGPGSGQQPQAAPIALNALPASALAQRPDLVEAARAVAAAAADERAADARQWPQITLGGSLGSLRRETGNELSSANGRIWSLGPLQVSFPIFDAGVRQANVASARASYDEAVALYQARARNAVREVEEALVVLQGAAARESDLLAARDGFDVSLEATRARYEGGLATAFELEDARRSSVAAASALIDLRRERAAAWIALYRALGGGWRESDLASAGTAASSPPKP